MRSPKIPKVPALSAIHSHDPRDCTVCQANAKKPTARRYGYPLAGRGTASSPTGWNPPRDLKPAQRGKRRQEEPDGYQPGPKHQGRGHTVDKGYTGRHRAYDAKHRRD